MGELAKFLVERLKRKERPHVVEIDRISNLPVELRVQILSFLSTKEAVQTCVLSKAWRDTWTSLPILFFDSREFLLDDQSHRLSDQIRIRRESEHKFERFVQAVLQERKATSELSHFVLLSETKDCVSCNSEAFKDCILSALNFKPRLLAVSACSHKMLSSFDIFSCVSIEEALFENRGARFENRGAPFAIGPSSVCLPHLKRLDLLRVTVNDDFLDTLFLGCPIIEELMLHYCTLTVSRISCIRLKKLGLFSCSFTKRIILTVPYTDVNVDFPRITLVSGPELISILSNVTWLTLALPGTLVKGLFENGVPRWPIFKNLKRLNLGGWRLNSDFDLVAFFLRSPNLQMLTLHGNNAEEVDTATDDKSNCEEPKDVTFQREWLEKVMIMKQGKSDEWVHQLIKNLRAHVKTIGEIKIV